MDVNKYIRAQAAIFNKDLIKSLKRLVPARSTFSKIGVEIKPTFLERPKLTKSNKLEKSLIGVGAQNIKISGEETNITDWDKDIYAGRKIDNFQPPNNDKNMHIEIASHTGSTPTLTEEIQSRYNSNLDISVATQPDTGSILFDIAQFLTILEFSFFQYSCVVGPLF